MKLIKKLEIQSKKNIIDFLNNQQVGRLASIDMNGFPQVIPMNFVYIQAEKLRDNIYSIKEDGIYMHSFRVGEKLDNIRRTPTTGFETDQHLAFLPSYYFHPYDASQADTLYISVVIKGYSYIVEDREEKTLALNSLMEKYQKEGHYEKLNSKMRSVQEVAIIKLIPTDMKGKYKIGQQWTPAYRLKIAKNILAREKENTKIIFEVMGIEILENGTLVIKKEPLL
ncbi:MAG TPA: pyridoxamine 5'-phosphate oxidase family protein [Nitrososphaeraceae archaeon]|nr:pyridoxamine 5'-phosphate oxidase family protein [Nitrososphaeraceae archaeon]